MFKVEFYTPEGLYKTVDADLLNVVTIDGQRGILPNHMPIVAPLVISKLEVRLNNKSEYYAISNGVLNFKDNLAKVIVETIEDKNSIDLQRAEAAKQRALNRLNSNNPSIDIERARIALNKALNRIDIFHL